MVFFPIDEHFQKTRIHIRTITFGFIIQFFSLIMKTQRWIQLNNNTHSKIIVLVILLFHFQINLIRHLNLIPLQKPINHNIEKHLIQLKQFPLQHLFIHLHCLFNQISLKQAWQINTVGYDIPIWHFQKHFSSFLNSTCSHGTLHKSIIGDIIGREILAWLHAR